MSRKILSFVDERAGLELVLPVTPPSYEWSHGSTVETIAMDELGELNLRGGKKLAQMTLELLLPAQAYPFCNPGAVFNPWHYIEQLKRWADSKTPIRYLVSSTPINVSVLLESVDFGERDGSGDVYAKVALREYQRLDAPQLLATETPQQTQRPAETGAAEQKSYTVQKGDTLSGIARKFYGKAQLYPRIAAANGIKNPHLIYPGHVLTIPAEDALPGAAAPTPAQTLADGAQYDSQTKTWR